MYYPDLSPYSYDSRHSEELPGVRNVGWLDDAHPYATGVAGRVVLAKLSFMAIHRCVNQMRGFHYCQLCSGEEFFAVDGGDEALLGSSEVWIPSKDGGLFASPDLVVHYVRDHDYEPPAIYVEALLALDVNAWKPPPEFAAHLRSTRR